MNDSYVYRIIQPGRSTYPVMFRSMNGVIRTARGLAGSRLTDITIDIADDEDMAWVHGRDAYGELQTYTIDRHPLAN